jgi:hypothetical protein
VKAWLLVAALLLAGCGAATTSSVSSSRTFTPSALVSPTATLSGGQRRDAEFMAELVTWAARDGYPLGERGDGFPIVADRDELIAAGHQVCASVRQGESMVSASADVMRAKGLSGEQAQAVGVAAEDVYCPQNRP